MRAALLVFVAGCAAAPAARAPAATLTPPPAPPAALFEFHVGFWVNLHQRLYAESGPRPARDPVVAATPEEQAAWDGAVAWYRARYPERTLLTLLYNDELVAANRALAAVERAPDLAAASLPPELRQALEAAAPVYRRTRWPEDERADRALIARLEPIAARLQPSLAPRLAQTYQSAWPPPPIRVDVSGYAGPVGAYTINDPAHITMAGHDPRHNGDTAVEILFHEASHTLAKPLIDALATAAAAQHKRVPPTSWHAVLFYTTGELVRRALPPGYTPYADANGLWTRSPDWTPLRPVLAAEWQPYLDGKRDFAAAVAAVVAALPATGAPAPPPPP